ncbi:enoyl-CoA hydratase [Novosphingobium pentaromativorans]|uniref:Enoyl-CoA hydratase/isomerase n=1 Tax=Novosphingobium pentaromativorans US6-1 TaxID=1088721 RepID=G6E7Z2_9SPHN|nr:enoyl-CoA hydratase [Novosphingobium pentaromativorans]AIT81490.1 enoyl-CoA hydratase [Novosphingobium pentaromativorans US6-1]EHJ62635.1 Enoyl-CoA hydratase/isomerase [Novosphingobium pentaromativorans US6-1]
MFEFILYDVADGIATITLNRPGVANAQHQPLLEELNQAWEDAAADDDVRVILLRAEGKHFSAGHDVTPESIAANPDLKKMRSEIPNTGLLELYKWEAKHYFGFSRRWRDIPKPSIAAVQGACIAGGLLLAWPCDIIIAADNARFSDPVVLMGIGGVEYHGHTWELGPRKAKEMLFTAKPIGAEEAEKRGMVNKVVPLADLETEAREMAAQIAKMHPHALAMAKRAVNQTMDIMGQYAALQSVFDIHQLGHASAYAQGGQMILTDHLGIKAAGKDKS